MAEQAPVPELPETPAPDWAEFYRNFEKPGYIAGFEIGHKLGGGVFGVVYKARRESIGKPYAIKFLRVEDPGVRQQVLGEIESVSLFAQVDHPNLVSIEDKGVVDGIPYIVMGYAGDETLKGRLEDRRLSEGEALHFFVQVARGVQALHEHSLVHFDLKPANLFLKGDVARVGDYGLSKLITETAMSLTTGRGTPYYMAPEMLRRKGDHRSDVYSLGVIFYECLCGEVPFTGDSEWEVLKGHEEKPVVFPEAIPDRYRPLIGRMLAKSPEDRYQTLAEVLRELQAPVGLGESIRLAPVPRQAAPRRAAPRRVPVRRVPPAPEPRSAPAPSIAYESGVAMSSVLTVCRRWWPWLLIFGGVAFGIYDSANYWNKDKAVALIVFLAGATVLGVRNFRHVFLGEPRPPAGERSRLSRWMPWLMVFGPCAWAFYDSFPHYMKDQALAILVAAAGVFGLGARAVRARRRRRRQRLSDAGTEV